MLADPPRAVKATRLNAPGSRLVEPAGDERLGIVAEGLPRAFRQHRTGPHDVNIVGDLNGHEQLDTTFRYYLAVDIRAAKEAHQKFLSLVRRSAPAPCSANRGRRLADETPLA